MTTLATISTVTKALGHSGRLRILAMLRAGPLSVCQIATVLDAPVSTVSGHLLELRHARLVHERRQGKWIYYRLTDGPAGAALLAPVLKALDDDLQVRRDIAAASALQGRSPAVLCEAAMDAARCGDDRRSGDSRRRGAVIQPARLRGGETFARASRAARRDSRFSTHHPVSASGNGNAASLLTGPDDEAKLDDELRDLD